MQITSSNKFTYEILSASNWNIVPCFSLCIMLELTVQYRNITGYVMGKVMLGTDSLEFHQWRTDGRGGGVSNTPPHPKFRSFYKA
jgi:hypothetical protein